MSVALQKQIRDNSEDIRGYLEDLGKWTKEMNIQEQRGSGGNVEEKAKPPVRGAVVLEEAQPTPTPEQEEQKLARDKMRMTDYYRAWDNFDVEAEEEKIERIAEQKQQADVASMAEQKRTTSAKPNMKVQLRSSVRAKTDDEFAIAKKDEANKLFAQQRLREARDTYSQALTYLKTKSELRATLLANRALCHLKLNDFVATITDSQEVLEFDPLHVKARFRKAMAHTKLRQWRQAQDELSKVVEQDTEDKKAQSELVFATRMVNEETAKRREHAKRLMIFKRPFTMPLRRLPVEEREGNTTAPRQAASASASASATPLRLVTKAETKQPYVIRSLRANEAQDGAPNGTRSAGAASTVPKVAAPNFYDFERRWRNERTADKRFQLLREWDLPRLCRESFSSELLLEIIEACAGREDAYLVLQPLQRVRRWDMACAGLTRSERVTLEALMHGSNPTLDADGSINNSHSDQTLGRSATESQPTSAKHSAKLIDAGRSAESQPGQPSAKQSAESQPANAESQPSAKHSTENPPICSAEAVCSVDIGRQAVRSGDIAVTLCGDLESLD